MREASAGDAATLARLDETGPPLGLVSVDEAEDVIAAHWFPVPDTLEDVADTDPVPEADALSQCEASCSDGVYDVDDPADHVTADEYAQVQRIRLAVGDIPNLGSGNIRLHTGTCGCRTSPPDAGRRVAVSYLLDLGAGVKVYRELAVKV